MAFDRFAADARIALRGFRRTPTFTVTAVLILGLAIGMAVAMFAVFQTVLLRPLPVIQQDRLVAMWTYRDPAVEYALSLKDIDAYRRESRTLTSIAGVLHWGATPAPLIDGDRTVLLYRAQVTGNFFDVLGARPVLGRLLRAEDGAKGAVPAMVLAYTSWVKYFGSDPHVIGRHLIEPYGRVNYTIVGVAPPGLDYPSGAGFWITPWFGTTVQFIAIGRLAPGATPAAARSELFSIGAKLEPDYHLTGAQVFTFPQIVLGNVRPALLVLTAAVGLLLLIGCVNVGNLLLLRASSRAREIAIRRALGATYGDIVRQLVVESGSLGLAGGLLGLAIAESLLRALIAFAPRQLPRVDDVQLSGAPIAGVVGVTVLAVVMFGVLPALLSARVTVASPLRLDSRTGKETRGRRRVQQWLVGSQVALALVMLAGAGLLARSLERLQRLDLGYKADHLSILTVSFNTTKYNSNSKILAWGDELSPKLRALPGVTSVTQVLIPPFLGANVFQWKFTLEGQSDADGDANPAIPVEGAGPDYFRTFDIPLRRGRGILQTDGEHAAKVVVVSEAVARRFWPGQDAIGKRVKFPGNDSSFVEWRTVVGVAGDIRYRALRDGTPTVYLPWAQSFWQGSFAIRTTTDLSALLPAVRRAVHDVDPELALWDARSMDDMLAGPLAQPRLNALLLSGFGLVALVLAAIGLYGVMSSVVREQTREIGIRMALGATQARVRKTVLTQALVVTSIGAAVGLVGALVTSRLLRNLLFEVSPADPIAILGAGGLLLAISLIAAYLPARRATRIDPVQALRAD